MVNHEHYPDPTAEIAIARADRELKIRRWMERNGADPKKVKRYRKAKQESGPRRDA